MPTFDIHYQINAQTTQKDSNQTADSRRETLAQEFWGPIIARVCSQQAPQVGNRS